MKNVFLSLLLIVAMSNSGYSQLKIDAGLKYAVGLNFPTGDVENTRNKFSPVNIIGFSDIHIVNFFSVQPELQYFSQAYNVFNDPILYKNYLNYFGLNVIPKFNIELNNGYLSFYTGIGFNFLLSASSKYKENGTGSEKVLDVKDLYKNTYVGGIIGVSTNQNIWRLGQLVLDTRYINNFNNMNQTNDPKLFLHQLSFSIGYVQKLVGYDKGESK